MLLSSSVFQATINIKYENKNKLTFRVHSEKVLEVRKGVKRYDVPFASNKSLILKDI